MAKDSTVVAGHQPPALRRDEDRRVEPSSLADLIQWFLTYDPHVASVRQPAVEALYQWIREQQMRDRADAFAFEHAEDRLAVGVAQALTLYEDERALHGWLEALLRALDEAKKTNEAIGVAYGLDPDEQSSIVVEAEKIPTSRERDNYLTSCWLETLCTAEIRVLGWAYRELHGRPFHPENF